MATISKFPIEKHVLVCIKITDLRASPGPQDLSDLGTGRTSPNEEDGFRIL